MSMRSEFTPEHQQCEQVWVQITQTSTLDFEKTSSCVCHCVADSLTTGLNEQRTHTHTHTHLHACCQSRFWPGWNP